MYVIVISCWIAKILVLKAFNKKRQNAYKTHIIQHLVGLNCRQGINGRPTITVIANNQDQH